MDGARRSPSSSPLKRSRAATAAVGAEVGDLILAVADAKKNTAAGALGALRERLARDFDLIPFGEHRLVWIIKFPMFEYERER